MENLTHSLSKKSYGGNGFGMSSHKSVYDDVFGGPPKFGVPTLAPRFEDYSEIFGGFHSSRGSSIPILDLPVVEEVELAFDVRSSRLDYSEVFGGFDGLDFAVSFEDLMRKSDGGDDSCDNAWSPDQSESLSDESDPASCERSQSLPNADARCRFGDARQFNVSYHKVNEKTSEKKISDRVAHIAQVQTIPGHACMINEAHASPIIEDEGPELRASGDLKSNTEFVGRRVDKRCFKKSISLPTNSGLRAPGSDPQHVESSGSAFTQKKPFVTVNDINLRTRPSRLPPPSRPPPVFAVKKGEPTKLNSKLRPSNSYAFERIAGESSPPFYDVEIDASSSKAASVAVKVAMEKAQAKIRSAKESLERKEVLQSHLKLPAQDDSMKVVEEEMNKTSSGGNSCKDDMVQEMFAIGCGGLQHVAQEQPTVIKMTLEASDLIDGENYIDLVEKPICRTNAKESSPQVSHKTEGTFAWRQEMEYFEVVETDMSLKAGEEDDESNVLQSIGSEEDGHGIEAATETSQPQEVIKEVKASKEAPKFEEKRNQLEIRKDPCEWVDNRERSNKTMESSCQKENQKHVKVDFDSCDLDMGKKRIKKAKQHGDKQIEKDADKSVANLAKAEWDVMKVEVKDNPNGMSERADSYEVTVDVHANQADESRHIVCIVSEECDKKLEEAAERMEDVKWEMLQEDRKKQEDYCEIEENEKKQKEVYQGKENESKLKEAIEQEDYVKRVNVGIEHEESENNLRTCEQEDKERRQKLDCEMEEKKRRVLETHNLVEDEKQCEIACETGELDARLSDFWEQDLGKSGSTVAFEEDVTEENSILTSALEGRKEMSQSAFKHEELSKQTEGANVIKWDGSDRMVNLDQGIHDPSEGLNINSLAGQCKLNCNTHETLEAIQAALSFGKDKKSKTNFKDGEQGLDIRTSEFLVEEMSLSFGKNQHDLQQKNHNIQMEDYMELPCFHDHVIDSNGAGIEIENSAHKQEKKVSQVACDPEKMKVNTHDKGQTGKVVNGVKTSFSEEITKETSTTHKVFTEWTEEKIGAALPSVVSDRKNTLNTHQRGTSQNAETKERHVNVTLAPEERKIEERLHQERELEKEHLRRIEEEREREREREKDRMAVDRAALEARERSSTETRDRAERAAMGRATAEARQRIMVEARGRLDKESVGARLRAERAAVERATAEARQRAFEKTMAEKASFEARERVERSVSDKFYGSSRNAEMRQSSSSSVLPDLQNQSAGTSNVLRYSYSSANAGVEGESPQRCKARLERYRRTAERAAKALAEKNMRDLLAQREQAERSRLAETLDAEVRRWSSGKEGNLRALLSTLQYILGPDSGWQPVPLTEVITSAAVKKAYRKATLCVHPDKLQQRGASIQQKYICEKIFDLLKEAWNTFNSEEW